jgi:hypothetical protein
MSDLAAVFEKILPDATEWVQAQSEIGLSTGRLLSPEELADARRVGVLAPEKIRLVVAPALPLPDDAALRETAVSRGLLRPEFRGLTLGYAIFIVEGHLSRKLLSHECRHVHQYENAGAIREFLVEYLAQIVRFGYHDAPYEIDARHYEID